MRPIRDAAYVAAVALALVGCATQRPVFYPNAKYQQAGEQAAQRDIDDCERLANQFGAKPGSGDAAVRQGASGAAIGAATGAVAGAISGGNVFETAAAGAAIGGAAGATAGATQSGGSSTVYKEFVGRCLAERGYEVIGWQ